MSYEAGDRVEVEDYWLVDQPLIANGRVMGKAKGLVDLYEVKLIKVYPAATGTYSPGDIILCSVDELSLVSPLVLLAEASLD